MRVAKKNTEFTALKQIFPDFSGSIDELENKLGDSGKLYRVWFDFSIGNRPTLFINYGFQGESKTDCVILKKD